MTGRFLRLRPQWLQRLVPSKDRTAQFYDGLSHGEVSRGLWGLEKRFDPEKIIHSASVDRYFRRVIRAHVGGGDRVLDVGCGSGGFTAVLAESAGEVIGVDLSEAFVAMSEEVFAARDLDNARAERGSGDALPFPDASFDAVTMIDVIHHLDDPARAIREACRVLRPTGRLLIFEPNKLNPALTFLCLFDPNEWGFLRFGTRHSYERLLRSHFSIEHVAYSGLLIGPDGPAFRAIADTLNKAPYSKALGWLNPKIFIAARPVNA